MLYSASSLALCCLEVLVHTDPDLIPDNYAWSWAELPLDPEVFDGKWSITHTVDTRRFGKAWIDSRRSLALLVPSVIVPPTSTDFNVFINPMHDAYNDIQWQHGGAFSFDPRLLFSKASE